MGFYGLTHLALWAAGVVVSSGCVAMNIPSQRHHDPADRGGMFGDFRGGSGGAHGTRAHGTRSSSGHSAGCGGCAQCGDGDEDDEWDADGRRKEKPPEIPWPRYHPVPTRPVFGPAG